MNKQKMDDQKGMNYGAGGAIEVTGTLPLYIQKAENDKRHCWEQIANGMAALRKDIKQMQRKNVSITHVMTTKKSKKKYMLT